MKRILYNLCLYSVFILTAPVYAQLLPEVCNNGIDDDGDGLIDLNDPECDCNIPSLIYNSSFEGNSQCPTTYGQIDRSYGWKQGNGMTSTDYLNGCNFVLEDLEEVGLYPFPHGMGVMGGAFINEYKEYLATCLSAPLQEGVEYTLKFHVACFPLKNTNYSPGGNICDPSVDFDPIAITLYGTSSCNNIPYGWGNNPTDNPNWVILGSVVYNPAIEWGVLTIKFTPQAGSSITTIMMGAPNGVLPQTYPTFSTLAPATMCSPYFLYDNLVLNESLLFEEDYGNICINSQVLTANPSVVVSSPSYQWYHNGVAVVGATASQYTAPEGSNPQEYSVKIIDATQCMILYPFNEVTPEPQITQNGCDFTLSAAAGMAPYQWYLNGEAIAEATGEIYVPVISGNYAVSKATPCGIMGKSEAVHIIVCSDLEIIKEITDVVNGEITFRLIAKNIGTTNDTEVVVTDILPSGYTYTSHTTANGTYVPVTGIWNIGNLSVGQEAEMLISAQVGTTGEHLNTATITGTGNDTNLQNNISSAEPKGKLYLSKQADYSMYYNIGEVITYTLELTNTGNVTVHDIVVADLNADGGSLTPSIIESLAPGDSITITAGHTITEADFVAGFVENQATAIGESYNEIFIKVSSDDPNTEEEEDPTLTPVVFESDLAVTKTDNQDSYTAGTDVTYTITVTNNGPSDAQNIIITDELPAGISMMQWSDNNGNNGIGALNETIALLQNGSFVIYTVVVSVPTGYEGILSNTATVSGSSNDPELQNNEAIDIDTECLICKEPEIPKGISPNGDSLNDSFDMAGQAPVSKLEVFNRYGNKVYSRMDYVNEWHGQGDNGNDLPVGTYYYAVYFKDGLTKTGWVYINR